MHDGPLLLSQAPSVFGPLEHAQPISAHIVELHYMFSFHGGLALESRSTTRALFSCRYCQQNRRAIRPSPGHALVADCHRL